MRSEHRSVQGSLNESSIVSERARDEARQKVARSPARPPARPPADGVVCEPTGAPAHAPRGPKSRFCVC